MVHGFACKATFFHGSPEPPDPSSRSLGVRYVECFGGREHYTTEKAEM
jgi:hypothetical protein